VTEPAADAPLPPRASATDPGRRRAYLVLLSVQLSFGIVVGLSWLGWAPRTLSYVLPDQSGHPVVVPAESESQVAGDGRFFVLAVLAGLIAGLIAWFALRRYRGPATLGWLAIGGLLAGLLAAGLGHVLAAGHDSGAVQTAIHPRLVLHAWPMVFVHPLAALIVYSILAGFSDDEQLSVGPTAGPALADPPEDSQLSVR
jgi:hypothetical protein